jgi:polysaccharide biosynthesis PFTS motif protein
MVYYSANSILFATDAPPRVAYGSGEALATWDLYVVPSEYLGQSLDQQHRRATRYVIAPLLAVEDDGSPCNLAHPERTIAVFDVTVFTREVTSQLIRTPTYYSPGLCDDFLSDLLRCAEAHDLFIARKQKRKFPPLVHPAYLRTFRDTGAHPRMIDIPPATSAVRLTATAFATVTMPFSTPAIYARHHGRPSVYYDASGRMGRHTSVMHGVRVLSGRSGLERWLEELLAARQSSAALHSRSRFEEAR